MKTEPLGRFGAQLSPERRALLAQLVRFVLTGGFLTLLYAVVYGLVVETPIPLSTPRHLQLANLCGYLVAMVLGYVMHSRWSFRGHGSRDDVRRTTSRFFIVSLISLGLNAFWTWLFAVKLGLGDYAPLIPISFVTPLVTFTLNRRWVFG